MFSNILRAIRREYADNLNVVQLDNGRFYHCSSLKITDKILLIFQLPYSPELNSIEKV